MIADIMPAKLATLHLRPERSKDQPFLREVFDDTRREEFSAARLPPELLSNLLAAQFNAQQQGYRASFPKAEFLIIALGGQSVGRMVVDRGPQIVTVVDISLLAQHRNQGVGTELIRGLADEAARAGQAVRLSVVRGQRAARLYQRLGFAKIGEAGVRDLMEWRAG